MFVQFIVNRSNSTLCVCVCIPILVTTFPEWLSGTEPLPHTPGAVRPSTTRGCYSYTVYTGQVEFIANNLGIPVNKIIYWEVNCRFYGRKVCLKAASQRSRKTQSATSKPTINIFKITIFKIPIYPHNL